MKWEYRIDQLHGNTVQQVEDILNFEGNQGWELICMDRIDKHIPIAVFKRQKLETRKSLMERFGHETLLVPILDEV